MFAELAIWFPGCRWHDIAEWHSYRETIIDGAPTSCYYATLDKMESWFLEFHFDVFPRRMYKDILRNMLHKDPMRRYTAVQVSQATRSLFDEIGKSPQNSMCPHCRLDLWVDLESHTVDTSDTRLEDRSDPKTAVDRELHDDISPSMSTSSTLSSAKPELLARRPKGVSNESTGGSAASAAWVKAFFERMGKARP